MNMKTFNLPDLGEGLQEAEIVSWHVAEGDSVVAEQPLVSVETDKAVVEIPSPHSGRIARLHAAQGEVVKVGAPLIEFGEGRAQDAGTVVGRLPEGDAPPYPRLAAKATKKPARPLARARATPAVRAYARNLGVDIETLAPTGSGGAVTRADVDAAVAAAAGGTAAAAVEGEALHGMRRTMAQKMAQSRDEVMPCTVTEEADVSAWTEGEDVTVRLVRAIAAGCAVAPAVNAWFDAAAMTRTVHRAVDIGIAADTEDGLFVPVLRDAAAKDAAAVRAELVRMKERLRARSLGPDAFRAPTITLSNFGALGAGLFATVVILPPQVAILGAGRIHARAVPVAEGPGAAVAVRRILPLSITFDHRAVTGGEATRFLAAMCRELRAAHQAAPG